MTAFILKRLFGMIWVVFIVLMLTFAMVRIAPGGPFDRERKLPPAIEKSIQAKYNLDQPVWRQFWLYFTDVLHLDLGPSTKYRNRTVNEIIEQTFPVSLTVGSVAFCLASISGITLGSIAAVRRNSFYDYASMTTALVAICVPVFVLAPICLLIFGLKLKWVPIAGWDHWTSVLLPAVLLSLPYMAYVARLTRNSLIETLQHDFIRTAIAKGVGPRQTVVHHAFKLALLPVLSFMGPMAAEILTGSIVVEKIFNLPGMGMFFIGAVFDRDACVVAGITLVFSLLLLLFNLAVDVIYHYLDPRIRLASA
jgi:oligopeptide transport system permease protein